MRAMIEDVARPIPPARTPQSRQAGPSAGAGGASRWTRRTADVSGGARTVSAVGPEVTTESRRATRCSGRAARVPPGAPASTSARPRRPPLYGSRATGMIACAPAEGPRCARGQPKGRQASPVARGQPKGRQASPSECAASVNLRFRNAGARLQEVEIATLVGLADVLLVHAAITALVARGGSAVQACRARRRSSSASGTCRWIRRFSISTSISSPVCTSASGPPTKLSGETCRMQAP